MVDTSFLELSWATGLILVGAFSLWWGLSRPRGLSFNHLYIFFLALFFGGGPWIAYVYNDFRLPSEAPGVLLTAYTGVLLVMLGAALPLALPSPLRRSSGGGAPSLTVAESALDRPLPMAMRPDLRAIGRTIFSSHAASRPFILAWFAGTVALYLITAQLTGILVSGTAVGSAIAAMPYWLVVLNSIVQLVQLGLLLWAVSNFWGERKNIGLSGLIVATMLFLFFLRGRRVLLIGLFIMFLPALVRASRLRLRYVVLGSLVIVALVTAVFPLFFNFRQVHQRIDEPDPLMRIVRTLAEGDMMPDTASSDLRFRSNMAARPMIVRFNCQVIEAQTEGKPVMGGRAMANAFLRNLPAAIYPEKAALPDTELYILHHYGLRLNDSPSTLSVIAQADFGLIGCFLYGSIIGITLLVFDRWVIGVHRWSKSLAFGMTGALLLFVAFVEQAAEAYFVLIRDMFIVWMLAQMTVGVWLARRTTDAEAE